MLSGMEEHLLGNSAGGCKRFGPQGKSKQCSSKRRRGVAPKGVVWRKLIGVLLCHVIGHEVDALPGVR